MTFQLGLPPPRWEGFEAVLIHGTDIFAQKARPARALIRLAAGDARRRSPSPLDCGGAPGTELAAEELLLEGVGRAFPAGRTPRVSVTLPGRGQSMMGLAVRVPEKSKPGDTFGFDVVQWDDRRKRVTGGIAVLLRIPRGRRKR